MPQRFLRPGLTTSQRFNVVSWQAQSFYVRLLTLVDDFGRYDAEPMLLRSHCFPFGGPAGQPVSLTTIDSICQQLSANALVSFYESDGKKFLQITRWTERVRAEKSRYPEPTCEQLTAIDSNCSPSPSPSPSPKAIKPVPPVLSVIEGFLEEWKEFRNSRKAMRHPMTPHSEELILNKLAERPTEALSAIQTAIEANWRGFEWSWYDDRKEKRVGANGKAPHAQVPRKIDKEYDQWMSERSSKKQ